MSRVLLALCLLTTGIACSTGSTAYSPPGPVVATVAPADAGPPPLNCGDVLICVSNCPASDSGCVPACEAQGSPAGSNLFAAFNGCIAAACPSTVGSVCDVDTAGCDTCLQNAQSASGACSAELNSCEADLSGGGPLSCAAVNSCLNNCGATDTTCLDDCVFDGTSSAQQLFQAAENCLNVACPEASGDVCATATTTCTDCLSSAQASGGACYTSVTNCQQDGSGTTTTGGSGGCAAFVNCLDDCAANDATCENNCAAGTSTQGQQLFQTLSDCVDGACPRAGGDVCATETTACDTCVANSQSSGGACYASLGTCESN